MSEYKLQDTALIVEILLTQLLGEATTSPFMIGRKKWMIVVYSHNSTASILSKMRKYKYE
jgi:hypothetical protein